MDKRVGDYFRNSIDFASFPGARPEHVKQAVQLEMQETYAELLADLPETGVLFRGEIHHDEAVLEDPEFWQEILARGGPNLRQELHDRVQALIDNM